MEKPHYTLIAALTIDGKIAKHPQHMSDWTSAEDKIFMRKKLDACDVIIVGNNTYKTAIKPLSKRNCIIFTKSIKNKAGDLKAFHMDPAQVNFKSVIKKRGYKKICILGGAQTYGYFLAHAMIDEMFITIEPIIFGDGIGLFHSQLKKEKKFQLQSMKKLNVRGSLLLHYVR